MMIYLFYFGVCYTCYSEKDDKIVVSIRQIRLHKHMNDGTDVGLISLPLVALILFFNFSKKALGIIKKGRVRDTSSCLWASWK